MDVERMRGELAQMVDDLAALVAVESPSSDRAATARCADAVARLGERHLGTAAHRVEVDGRTHLWWRFGGRVRVVLLGHFDTVWPVGTTARWPFEATEERATGPGCFDMKGGIVQLFHAVTALDERAGVAIVLTSDEEIGSPSSRGLIEEMATGARAVLVLEPSADGALKTERKGVSHYRLDVAGRAAHAGLDPEKGINAAVELARQTIAIAELGDAAPGTTVTPTLLAAGSSGNSVPGDGSLHVDVRVPSVAEEERVEASLRALTPALDGATLRLERTSRVPPMARTASAELFAAAREIATELGLAPLEQASVGGGSDGNFTAGLGIPTLDGLGAVGGGAHADAEHISIPAMAERAALVAALTARLLQTEG